MFLKSQRGADTFIQFGFQNRAQPSHEDKRSLIIVLCVLTIIIILSAYSSLFIADSTTRSIVEEGFTESHYIAEAELTSRPLQLWNCLGNYTTDPEGNAICISISPEQRTDSYGEKYITSSSF